MRLTKNKMEFTNYDLTDVIRQRFPKRHIDHGCQVVVLTHSDPQKVWIISFDTLRYDYYRLLGIEVGNKHEKTVKVVNNGDLHWLEFIIFECEKLCTPPPEKVKHIHEYIGKNFYQCFNLPSPVPELENAVYAYYSVRGSNRIVFDCGAWNALIRKDGTLFLSDTLSDSDSSVPNALWYDTEIFELIYQVIKGEINV